MDKRTIKFRGFCDGLSLEDRTYTNDTGHTYYPIRIRLRVSRDESGISKEDMGRRLGLHRTTILRYETGAIRTIDNATLAKWARECNVSLSWLLDGGPSGNKKIDLAANRAGCRMMGYPEPIPFM